MKHSNRANLTELHERRITAVKLQAAIYLGCVAALVGILSFLDAKYSWELLSIEILLVAWIGLTLIGRKVALLTLTYFEASFICASADDGNQRRLTTARRFALAILILASISEACWLVRVVQTFLANFGHTQRWAILVAWFITNGLLIQFGRWVLAYRGLAPLNRWTRWLLSITGDAHPAGFDGTLPLKARN